MSPQTGLPNDRPWDVFESAPVAAIAVDGSDGRIMYANPACAAVLGRAPGDLRGQLPTEIAPALTAEGVQPGGLHTWEIEGPDGITQTALGTVMTLDLQGGNMRMFLLWRQSGEETENLSTAVRAHTEHLLTGLGAAIAEYDIETGRFRYANQHFEQIFGQLPSEVDGVPWPGPWWDRGMTRRLERLRKRWAGDPGWAPEQARLQRAGGEARQVMVQVLAGRSGIAPTAIIAVHDLGSSGAPLLDLASTQGEIALVMERERIARDLHDQAIQQLFLVGMSLVGSLSSGDFEGEVNRAVDRIDDAIRGIRSIVFSLRVPPPMLGGLENALLSVCGEIARVLGFDPVLHLEGNLDEVDLGTGQQVLAVVRELLSNAARHSSARGVWVDVTLDAEQVSVEVRDDGAGLRDGPTGGSGLENMRRRAAERGGGTEITGGAAGGTSVRWWVPRRPASG